MAELRSSNPVFTGQAYRRPAPTPDQLRDITGMDRRLTVEDVTMHTGGLLVLLAVMAGIGWAISPGGDVPGIAFAAGLVALGLAFAVSFMRVVRPALVIGYTVLEGIFLGGISHGYESAYQGIVGQALLGTFAVFAVMLALHRSGRLRATPRMTRIVIGATLGIVALSVLNLLLASVSSFRVPGFSGHGSLALLITLGILVVGALQFTLDFTFVEQAVAAGAPQREAWRYGFGLMVSFVWVYITLLRLISILRD